MPLGTQMVKKQKQKHEQKEKLSSTEEFSVCLFQAVKEKREAVYLEASSNSRAGGSCKVNKHPPKNSARPGGLKLGLSQQEGSSKMLGPKRMNAQRIFHQKKTKITKARVYSMMPTPSSSLPLAHKHYMNIKPIFFT